MLEHKLYEVRKRRNRIGEITAVQAYLISQCLKPGNFYFSGCPSIYMTKHCSQCTGVFLMRQKQRETLKIIVNTGREDWR